MNLFSLVAASIHRSWTLCNVRLDDQLAISSGHVTDFCLWFPLKRESEILSAQLSKCLAIIHNNKNTNWEPFGLETLSKKYRRLSTFPLKDN